jgi:hypothetical protein
MVAALREGLVDAGQPELTSHLDPQQTAMAYYGSLFRAEGPGA